jgi:hypothetical protein
LWRRIIHSGLLNLAAIKSACYNLEDLLSS